MSVPTKRIELCRLRSHELPDTAVGFAQFIVGQVESIPEAFRAEARISLEHSIEYGDSYAELVVEFWRPLTAEESELARQESEVATAKQIKALEKQLAQLRERKP